MYRQCSDIDMYKEPIFKINRGKPTVSSLLSPNCSSLDRTKLRKGSVDKLVAATRRTRILPLDLARK